MLNEVGTYSRLDWEALTVKIDSALASFDNRNIIGSFPVPSQSFSPVMTPGQSATYFALYQAAENAEFYSDAWKYLEFANNLNKQRRNKFLLHLSLKRSYEMMGSFTKDFLQAMPTNDRREPIFVIGMPYSGCEVLQGLLNKHSRIFAMGANQSLFDTRLRGRIEYYKFYGLFSENMDHQYSEVLDRIVPYSSDVESILDEVREEIMKEYIGAVYTAVDHPDEVYHVVDTSYTLYHYVGYIRMLFPHAIIVNILRDPMDTVFGCFRGKSIPFHNMAWSYNLTSIRDVYSQYLQLMTHWRTVSPNSFIDMSTDELLRDPESVLTPLLTSLNLEFEPTMLADDFRHKVVDKGLWRKYSHHLSPLISAIYSPLRSILQGMTLPLEHVIDWQGALLPTDLYEQNECIFTPTRQLHPGRRNYPSGRDVSATGRTNDHERNYVTVPIERHAIGSLLQKLGLETGLIIGLLDGSQVSEVLDEWTKCTELLLAGPEDFDIPHDVSESLADYQLGRNITLLKTNFADLMKGTAASSLDVVAVFSVWDYCSTRMILEGVLPKLTTRAIVFGANYFHDRGPTYHPAYDAHSTPRTDPNCALEGVRGDSATYSCSEEKEEGGKYVITCPSGSQHYYLAPGGVKGAVDDFAHDLRVTVSVTYLDEPEDFLWMIRPYCGTVR